MQHAYISTQANGQTAWIESANQYIPIQRQCTIYYATLNSPRSLHDSGVVCEYSGRACVDGRRVMGVGIGHALCTTHIVHDDAHVFDVPRTWSMQQAVTVPVAYASAYYALCVRARVHAKQSVFVHDGDTPMGMAAIAVAMSIGCNVYTTVG